MVHGTVHTDLELVLDLMVVTAQITVLTVGDDDHAHTPVNA